MTGELRPPNDTRNHETKTGEIFVPGLILPNLTLLLP